MGWWIFFGILALILVLPLGASIFYDAAGVRVLVITGPIRFTVFPMKKKEKTPEAKKEPEKAEEPEPAPAQQPELQPEKKEPLPLPEAPKPPKPAKEKEPAGGSLTDFLPLLELVLKFVGEFFHRTLHIDVLYLKLTMAADDPADLAINYGKTWAALGNLWPYIDRMFTIKKRDIQLQCDFEGSETLVNARVDITVTLARLLGLVLGYAFRIVVKFLKIMWNRNKAAESAKKNQQTQTNEGGAI